MTAKRIVPTVANRRWLAKELDAANVNTPADYRVPGLREARDAAHFTERLDREPG